MKCQSVTNAHGRSEILGIVLTPSLDLATIGLDGFLRVWTADGNTLVEKKKVAIPSPYLHCFKITRRGLTIGLADGSLMFLDTTTYQIIDKIKLHSDLPTDLIELEDQFISSSLDGTVVRFRKNSFQVIQRANFNSPIWKLKQFVNSFYISSQLGSYLLADITQPLQYAKCIPNSKWKGFSIFNDQIYAFNNSQITDIASNSILGQGCDILISKNDSLIAIREGQIGMIKKRGSQFQSCWHQIPQLQEGYQIRCAVQQMGKLMVVGDSGKIYVFQVQQTA